MRIFRLLHRPEGVIITSFIIRLAAIIFYGTITVSSLSTGVPFFLKSQPLFGFWQFITFVSDGAIAYVIYLIVRDYFKKNTLALKLAWWYALSPVSIFIALIFGVYESLWIFLTLISWYLISVKNKAFLAGVLFALPATFALPAVFLLPLVIVSAKTIRGRILFATSFMAFFVLLSLPVITTSFSLLPARYVINTPTQIAWGAALFIDKLIFSMKEFFSFIGIYQSFLRLISKTYWLVLIGVYLIYIVKTLTKNRKINFFQTGQTSLVIFLLLTPLLGIEHLLWLVPFLLLTGNPFFWLFSAILTLTFLMALNFSIALTNALFFTPLWLLLFLTPLRLPAFYGLFKKGWQTLLLFKKEIIRQYKLVITARKLDRRIWLRICGFFILVILLFYGKSFFAFFQADEWYFFSKYYTLLSQPFGVARFLLAPLLEPLTYNGHFTPILPPIGLLQFVFFRTNFVLYQLLSMALHVGVTLSIFYFCYLFSKKNLLFALLAGLFFAVSAVHFQAVAWVAAVGVQIALLFAVLSLIFLVKYEQKKQTKDRKLSLLFLALALFSKESSIFLIFTYPLIICLFHKEYLQKQRWLKKIIFIFLNYKSFWVLSVSFFVITFLYQWYFKWVSQLNGILGYSFFPKAGSFWELGYRTISWILKSFIQTFFPSNFLYFIGEQITIWGFPSYASEAAVRGINFLVFSQTAAIELFIYPVALLLIFLIYKMYQYFSRHDKTLQDITIVGFFIILANVVPFIFLTNSLVNLFGSVTLLDSRHLYTTSFGAALLFAGFFLFLLNLNKKFKWFLVVWILINWLVLNGTLSSYGDTGFARKLILNKITSTVPILGDKTVIFIKSNVGYYGFDVMPPFQTNPGRILALRYWEKNQLGVKFLSPNLFSKGGIRGQGYVEAEGKGFGYFVEEKDLMEQIVKQTILPSDIYAFSWNGKKNTISDITTDIRERAGERLALVLETKDWQVFTDSENKLVFRFPKEMKLSDLTDPVLATSSATETPVRDIVLTTKVMELRLTLWRKLITTGYTQFAYSRKTDDGKTIGDDITFRNITMLNGEIVTTSYPMKGNYPIYFMPILRNNLYIFEARVFGKDIRRQPYNTDIEKILSTIVMEEPKVSL